VVDTPGFGAAADNQDCWHCIVADVDEAFESYMTSESKVVRTPTADTRVHCCLYFLSPSGHGLKPLDIAAMQQLQHKVNLVPVIGKADLLTPVELAAFKTTLLNELEANSISIYTFPTAAGDADESLIEPSPEAQVVPPPPPSPPPPTPPPHPPLPPPPCHMQSAVAGRSTRPGTESAATRGAF
jgi:septin family protein